MRHNYCMVNLLKFIHLLQKNSCEVEEDCTRPFLGSSISNSNYNTRVISFYKKDGSLFITPYFEDSQVLSSSFFRVMNVEEDCCTLLILRLENGIYSSTNQFITVRTSCMCAIRCIEDVFITNL